VAQLGTPDMRVPIAYGLSWPDRMVGRAGAGFQPPGRMSFESFDSGGAPARFPGLQLAWEVLAAPGTRRC
jgi:1-deoxy-D-xylulose-5-phosphate reductoisomerase